MLLRSLTLVCRPARTSLRERKGGLPARPGVAVGRHWPHETFSRGWHDETPPFWEQSAGGPRFPDSSILPRCGSGSLARAASVGPAEGWKAEILYPSLILMLLCKKSYAVTAQDCTQWFVRWLLQAPCLCPRPVHQDEPVRWISVTADSIGGRLMTGRDISHRLALSRGRRCETPLAEGRVD